MNSGGSPEDCLRDAVAAFDSFMAHFAKELARPTPMTERRRQRLQTQSFHDLNDMHATFNDWFDIDVCTGIKEAECRNVEIMFYRRHVYEHNGGEVHQQYLDRSGDTTVRLKRIHEAQQGAHALLSPQCTQWFSRITTDDSGTDHCIREAESADRSILMDKTTTCFDHR